MSATVTIIGQAVEVLPPAAYLSDAYFDARRTTVSASEIAAIIGVSPWTSRFDLWWRKASNADTQAEHAGMRRGRRLEGLVVEDFADAHPEFYVQSPVGFMASIERPWQTATPDGAVYEIEHRALGMVAGLEAKTAGSRDGWGEAGTDEIPVQYRAQALWQLDVYGVDVTYVPVWFGTDYREYVVHRDETDLAFMRARAVEFLDDLRNNRQPPVDGHVATTRRLKYLHPSVVDGEVEIPPHWLQWRATAVRDIARAKERKDRYENWIRDRLGDLRVGTVLGRKVVSRSAFTKHEFVMPEHTENRLYFSPPPKPKEED